MSTVNNEYVYMYIIECSAASLNDFNSKVLVFVDKMKRTLPDDLTVPPFAGDPKPEPEHQIFSPEKLLIYWLWDRLDVSPHDDVLTGQEVEAYITKLAATVTSRECVTSYFSRCDRNSDRKISLAEWCFCHGLDNRKYFFVVVFVFVVIIVVFVVVVFVVVAVVFVVVIVGILGVIVVVCRFCCCYCWCCWCYCCCCGFLLLLLMLLSFQCYILTMSYVL